MSSYIKDKDAHTRGVNAIAAVDGVTGRRRLRERQRAMAMARRDHAMANVARQAFSPRAAMGMVDIGPLRPTIGTILTPPRPTGGAGKQFGLAIAPTSPAYVPAGTGTRYTGLSPNATATYSSGAPLVGGGGVRPTTLQPPTEATPPSLWPTNEPGTAAPPVVTSGGGGTGLSWTSTPTVDEGALTDINNPGEVDTTVAVEGMSRNKKLLLLAGAAGLAYFLFFRKKKEG